MLLGGRTTEPSVRSLTPLLPQEWVGRETSRLSLLCLFYPSQIGRPPLLSTKTSQQVDDEEEDNSGTLSPPEGQLNEG